MDVEQQQSAMPAAREEPSIQCKQEPELDEAIILTHVKQEMVPELSLTELPTAPQVIVRSPSVVTTQPRAYSISPTEKSTSTESNGKGETPETTHSPPSRDLKSPSPQHARIQLPPLREKLNALSMPVRNSAPPPARRQVSGPLRPSSARPEERMHQRKMQRKSSYAPPSHTSQHKVKQETSKDEAREAAMQEELQSRLETLANELAATDEVVYEYATTGSIETMSPQRKQELEHRRKVAGDALNEVHVRCGAYNIAVWCPSQKAIIAFQANIEDDITNIQNEIMDLVKRGKPADHLTILRSRLLKMRYFWRVRLNLIE